MRSKWCKYVLTLAVVVCGIYAGSMKQGVFARESAQAREIGEGEMEDLKWQLKQMEEGVKRQQEQIQALKNRIKGATAALDGKGTYINTEYTQIGGLK